MCHPLEANSAVKVNDLKSTLAIPCSKAMGALGTIIVISALAFAILGLVQPEWFTQALGTVGDPHSWALWTIFGGSIVVGGGLIGYAIFSSKTVNQVKSHSSNGTALKPSAAEKTTLHSRKDLQELFTEEIHLDANFLDKIPDYPKQLPGNVDFEKELLKNPIMKGTFEKGEEWRFSGLEFIILKLKCVSPPEKIREAAIDRMKRMDLDSIMDQLDPSITDTKKNAAKEKCIQGMEKKFIEESALLLFLRSTNDKWQQLHVRYEGETISSSLTPSFIERVEGGDVGLTPNPFYADENYQQLLEKGILKLKKLMKGEKVTDHREQMWQLDDS